MKRAMLSLALTCRPVAADPGRCSAAARPDRWGGQTRAAGPRPAGDRGRRAAAGRRGQREGPDALRRRAGPQRPPLRGARRHGADADQHQTEPPVEFHRARHRRGQRLRGTRRVRAHHARRARAAAGRVRAGRRARPRDHSHHRAAHRPRDPEEQEHPARRQRNPVGQRRPRQSARRQHLPRFDREGLRPRRRERERREGRRAGQQDRLRPARSCIGS